MSKPATREWFRQECWKYRVDMTAFADAAMLEKSGHDSYPGEWNARPQYLPGQVWASRPRGAVLILRVVHDNPLQRTVADADDGTVVTRSRPPNASGCLVYGPRAPWCPRHVWETVDGDARLDEED